jgi:hypothetical protein
VVGRVSPLIVSTTRTFPFCCVAVTIRMSVASQLQTLRFSDGRMLAQRLKQLRTTRRSHSQSQVIFPYPPDSSGISATQLRSQRALSPLVTKGAFSQSTENKPSSRLAPLTIPKWPARLKSATRLLGPPGCAVHVAPCYKMLRYVAGNTKIGGITVDELPEAPEPPRAPGSPPPPGCCSPPDSAILLNGSVFPKHNLPLGRPIPSISTEFVMIV